MKTISLKIDTALDRWLENEARRLGRSKSAIAREALERSQKKQDGASCHDLMQGACGSMKSGIKDLATHRKHLKGFGR